MPPRLNPFTASRSLSLLRCSPGPNVTARTLPIRGLPLARIQGQTRCNSDKPGSKDRKDGGEPKQDPLPHVSEEAAEVGKIMGGKEEASSPELEQGTPISEVITHHYPGCVYSWWESTVLIGDLDSSAR